MAETAEILNPERIVLLPDLKAGCSLPDSALGDRVAERKAANPGSVLISYVNYTAQVKAISDIICTRSNAERVIASGPNDTVRAWFQIKL
jgi:quinolinate synthase